MLSPQWLHAEIQRNSARFSPDAHYWSEEEKDPSSSDDDSNSSTCLGSWSLLRPTSSKWPRSQDGDVASQSMRDAPPPDIVEPRSTCTPSSTDSRVSLVPQGTAKGAFDQGAFLGEGAYGTVIQATHRIDGSSYALKRIVLDGQEDVAQVLREVQVMAGIPSHRHVVRYHNSWVEAVTAEGLVDQDICPSGASDSSSSLPPSPPSLVSSMDSSSRSLDGFEPPASLPCWDVGSTDSARPLVSHLPAQANIRRYGPVSPPVSVLYIQMELCDGTTLADWLSNEQSGHSSSFGAPGGHDHNDPLDLRLDAVHQVLQGVAHLHSAGVEHRDLSPRNIFRAPTHHLGESGEPCSRWVVGDFTFAQPRGSTEEACAPVGTPLYAAPELGEPQDHVTHDPRPPLGASDVYAAGLIAAEACLGCHTRMETVAVLQDLRHQGRLPSHLQRALGQDLSTLIQRMVVAAPGSRPTMPEVVGVWANALEERRQPRTALRALPIRDVAASFCASQHAMALRSHLVGLLGSRDTAGAELVEQLRGLQDLIAIVLSPKSDREGAEDHDAAPAAPCGMRAADTAL